MNSKSYGVISGLAAFAAWGLLPAYWKQMQAASPFEILCHRIVWSFVFLALILFWQKRWDEVREIFRDLRKFRGLVVSGLLVGANWFIYIWAVNSGNVLETSLGYYINPMVSVLIGCFLLGETFSRLQSVALGFAAAGVAYSLVGYGSLPLFALGLAFSFGFYGYCRKRIQVAPIAGLFIETLVLTPPALGVILFKAANGTGGFAVDTSLTLWMIGSGVATSMPLLWFAAAARRLNLSTVGVLQYLAPSLAFILGVFVYLEPFSTHTLVTFACIWAGVALYIFESLKNRPRA